MLFASSSPPPNSVRIARMHWEITVAVVKRSVWNIVKWTRKWKTWISLLLWMTGSIDKMRKTNEQTEWLAPFTHTLQTPMHFAIHDERKSRTFAIEHTICCAWFSSVFRWSVVLECVSVGWCWCKKQDFPLKNDHEIRVWRRHESWNEMALLIRFVCIWLLYWVHVLDLQASLQKVNRANI